MTFPVNVKAKDPKPHLIYFTLNDDGLPNEPLTVDTIILVESSDGSKIDFAITSMPTWVVPHSDAGTTFSSLTTPATVFLARSPTAPAGPETGTIEFSSSDAGNSPLEVPITLPGAEPKLAANPPAIQFFGSGSNAVTESAQISGTPGTYTLFPEQTTFEIPATGSADVTFTVPATGGASGVFTFEPVGSTVRSLDIPYQVASGSKPVVTVEHNRAYIVPEPRIPSEVFYVRSTSNTTVTPSATATGGATATVDTHPIQLVPGTKTAIPIRYTLPSGPGAYVSTISLSNGDGTVAAADAISINYSSFAIQYNPSAIGLYNQSGILAQSQTPELTRSRDANAVPSQTINLPGSGQSYAAIGPDWLTLTPPSGKTPQTLTAAVNPTAAATLGPGSYLANIVIAISSVPNPLEIPVNLVIGAAPLIALVNAASGLSAPVSPGEIVSIFGSNIGPSTAAGLTLTSAGAVSTTLGSTQVLFDGVPAPLAYAGSGQINAIVPYEVGGHRFTKVVIQRNGTATGAGVLTVADSNPAIFAVQGGSGQGAILNQDNSYNSASNPAAAGSIVTLFATGEGPLAPAVATGSVTSSTGPTFPAPVLPVSVTVAGNPATLVYAGEAPGFASGVFQLDVTIPQGTPSGPQPIVLTVGNNDNTTQKITVAVK
jgi:uncharacterized protein (TIGR03437 family)